MSHDGATASAFPLPPTLAKLRTAAIRWALAHGRSLNPATLSVIIAAQAECASAKRQHLHRWTTEGVLRFLFGDLSGWCNEYGIELPRHPGETLLTYLDFLDDHARLAKGSSLFPELHAAIVELCGLGNDGRRLPGRTDAMVIPLRHRALRHNALA